MLVQVTTTYLFDVNDERIALGASGATTTYPLTFYNLGTSSGKSDEHEAYVPHW